MYQRKKNKEKLNKNNVSKCCLGDFNVINLNGHVTVNEPMNTLCKVH